MNELRLAEERHPEQAKDSWIPTVENEYISMRLIWDIQLLVMKEKRQINKIVRRQRGFSVVRTTVDQSMTALKT